MTPPVRLGAVDYLNVRPLVHRLDRAADRVTLRFDPPSRCAELLARGDIDLGTVPSITYLDRRGDCIVPGLCIGSEGAVASVALFTRRAPASIRSIALDTSSRTSAMLTKILCARRFGIAPEFVSHAPDLAAMLEAADAALLIGDPALFANPAEHGADKIDLGLAWTEMTDLPFVWAFWSGPADAVGPDVIDLLQRTAEEGMRHRDEIADAYCAGDPPRQAVARAYLRDNLRFRMDARALDGLRRYYQEAASLGLVPAARAPEFF